MRTLHSDLKLKDRGSTGQALYQWLLCYIQRVAPELRPVGEHITSCEWWIYLQVPFWNPLHRHMPLKSRVARAQLVPIHLYEQAHGLRVEVNQKYVTILTSRRYGIASGPPTGYLHLHALQSLLQEPLVAIPLAAFLGEGAELGLWGDDVFDDDATASDNRLWEVIAAARDTCAQKHARWIYQTLAKRFPACQPYEFDAKDKKQRWTGVYAHLGEYWRMLHTSRMSALLERLSERSREGTDVRALGYDTAELQHLEEIGAPTALGIILHQAHAHHRADWSMDQGTPPADLLMATIRQGYQFNAPPDQLLVTSRPERSAAIIIPHRISGRCALAGGPTALLMQGLSSLFTAEFLAVGQELGHLETEAEIVPAPEMRAPR